MLYFSLDGDISAVVSAIKKLSTSQILSVKFSRFYMLEVSNCAESFGDLAIRSLDLCEARERERDAEKQERLSGLRLSRFV